MTRAIRVLIVDDEAGFREVLQTELARAGFDVEAVGGGREALEKLGERAFDVVLLDLMMPGWDGIETLRRIRDSGAQAEVVMMTGQGTIASAVEAMRAGAHDYLTKPCQIEEVDAVCRRAAGSTRLRRENRLLRREARAESEEMLGTSPSMAALVSMIEKAAVTDYPVLILGESGTGKELVARATHRRSGRADSPMVSVNCASLNASLLESELFGHEKGAFTGATRAHEGLFEAADGGTLFLDEIGDMGLELQARLLRVLQFGEVRRVGSTVTKTVDVRILAATNRELETAIREGTFREDLYFRLQTVVLRVPPLRERIDDLPQLAEHFLEKASQRLGRRRTFAAGAMKVLRKYEWPGNVRELENLVHRLAILAEGDTIREADVVASLYCSTTPASRDTGASMTIEEAEKRHIARVLTDCEGRKPEAAEHLGVSLKTLYNKIQKHGL